MFEPKIHDDDDDDDDDKATLAHAYATKCSLCNNNLARYTCPKCSVPYCGVECYRSRIHSECSERFYQQNVRDEIASRNVTQEQEEAILHLLTKEVSDVFDDEGMDLDTRLEGLDLDTDTEKIWERLTQDEKEEFERTMGRYVPSYKAWWKECDLVHDESAPSKPLPKLYPNIQRIEDIFRGKPNENLKYNIINVLYTYVCIHRLYNGDLSSILEQITDDILGVSLVLRGDGNFSDLRAALEHPADTLLQMKELEWSSDLVFGFYCDVIEVISHTNLQTSCGYVLYCLSDLWYVFGNSLKLRKKSSTNCKQSRTALIQAQKKVYFFLCWARDSYVVLSELCEFIRLELQAKRIELKEFNESNKRMNRKLQTTKQNLKQPLIEEIT